MPERFDSNIYAPDIAKLMRDAFATAWLKVRTHW
jgi:hypothetical protein